MVGIVMARGYRNELVLGLFILAAAAALGYFAIKVGGFEFREGVRVAVYLDDARGLVKDADVRIAGVKVGRVEHLGVAFDQAAVTLLLDPVAEVRRDVVAGVRAKSLLGEKYVHLQPVSSTAPVLETGDQIANVASPADVNELVATLGLLAGHIDPEDVRLLIRTLSSALAGKDAELGEILVNFSHLAGALHENLERNEEKLGRIVDNLDELVADLNDVVTTKKGAIAQTIDNTESLSSLLNERAPELVEDLSEVAGDLKVITAAFRDQSPELSARVAKISGNLETITEDFANRSPQLADTTEELLANLAAVSERVPATLDSFNTLSPQLAAFLERLGPILEKLNKIDRQEIESILREMGIKVHLF